jgi:hypothetical protein
MYTMNEITDREGRRETAHRPQENPAAPPGATHASLRDVTTDAIRQAILSGRYVPGERLVEDRLAAEFAFAPRSKALARAWRRDDVHQRPALPLK